MCPCNTLFGLGDKEEPENSALDWVCHQQETVSMNYMKPFPTCTGQGNALGSRYLVWDVTIECDVMQICRYRFGMRYEL